MTISYGHLYSFTGTTYLKTVWATVVQIDLKPGVRSRASPLDSVGAEEYDMRAQNKRVRQVGQNGKKANRSVNNHRTLSQCYSPNVSRNRPYRSQKYGAEHRRTLTGQEKELRWRTMTWGEVALERRNSEQPTYFASNELDDLKPTYCGVLDTFHIPRIEPCAYSKTDTTVYFSTNKLTRSPRRYWWSTRQKRFDYDSPRRHGNSRYSLLRCRPDCPLSCHDCKVNYIATTTALSTYCRGGNNY